MQQTQIVTHGVNGVLADRLRELAQAKRVWLRETSQLAACRNLLATTVPPILVLVLGREIERELAMLEEVHASLAGTATIVIGEADNPALAGLVWDLGATFALFPPMPVERITELVERLLEAATR